MAKEKVLLNGVEFEVKHVGKDNFYEMMLETLADVKPLEECYKRPSYAKQYIYNMWCEWFNSLDNGYRLYFYGVNSFNTHMFTLKCTIESLVDSADAVLYITKTKHVMYVA